MEKKKTVILSIHPFVLVFFLLFFLDVAALPFECLSLSCFDLLVPRLLLMSVSGSCCTIVIMR